MKKFKGKYCTDPMRKNGWDYTRNGVYFVTVCTHERGDRLGTVVGEDMILNEEGRTVDHLWQEIPGRFSFIRLGEYIVMPDHIHGILVIDRAQKDGINAVSTRVSDTFEMDRVISMSGIVPSEMNPMVNLSLSTVVRWFKGRATHDIRKMTGSRFRWQSGFHDRILRDGGAIYEARKYIRDNPRSWAHGEHVDDDRRFT